MGFSTLLAATLLAVAPAASVPTVAAGTLSPTPQFRHYGVNQGLPSSEVYTLVQDQRGVIWMGTHNGLVRYNSSTFKVFRHVPGDDGSLSGNDVSSVLIDSDGRLWAGGDKGINLFDPLSSTFRRFQHQTNVADSLASNSVIALAKGRDGSLWAGVYGAGLDHMTTPGHFDHLRHHDDDPASLVSDNVLSLFSRDDGRLWIGTERGMDIREPDGSIRHVQFEGLTKAPQVWRIDGIDGIDNRVRAGTTDGLFLVDHNGVARPLAADKLPAQAIMASVRDRHGALWLGTMDGLYLVEPDGRSTHFPPRPLLPGGQPGRGIWQLMLDHEGGLWVATRNSGVAYLSPDWRDFSHYAHRPDDPSSLSGSRILALASDGDGQLWVAGNRGQLDKLDPATGAVTHYARALRLNSGTIIAALARAGKYGTWIGHHHGLTLFDGQHIRKENNALPGHSVSWLTAAADGTAYASPPAGGAFRVDPATLESTQLTLAFPGEGARETHNLVIHNGTLWRTSHAGLSRLASDQRHLVAVPGVSRGVIHALGFSGNDLWLTRPEALEHYRVHAGKAVLVARIGAADGWPGVEVKNLAVDQHHRVWLFTDAGLWRYDPSHRTFRRFTQADGLPSAEFTSRQLVHSADGTLFAGTLGGVIGFHPDTVQDHPRPPRLVLTTARVRRDRHDVSLPLDSHALHLHWNNLDLRITAQALSYINPARNHYRFRLRGFDTDWVDTGTRGMREFAGLGSGTYRLQVQAAGPSGAWSQLTTPLSIRVDAPPWTTPWAWAAYVLAALLLSGLILLAWRRRLEQQHRLQLADQHRCLAEAANHAKTRFLATLSHEIRTPMTGVLGMAELLLETDIANRERGYAQSIRHSGKLLLKLVNDALDMARIESGHLQLEPAPLRPRELIEEVRELLAGQVAGKPLTLCVSADADVPAWLLGDDLRIKQILLNLANNAIKFTDSGEVGIHAYYATGELCLIVSDTGPGISAADRERLFRRFEQADSPQRRSGSGLGLAICRELVALMNGRITLDSAPDKGSRFSVFLPLSTASAPAATPVSMATPTATALHLLLVEDNATVAEVICGLLQARGHTVVHADHGLDALSELENQSFDAVLLDLDLPALDGYQLAQMIRQRDDAAQQVPIIAITARSGGNEEQRSREAGMDAFARKPLSGDELAATLLAVTGKAEPPGAAS